MPGFPHPNFSCKLCFVGSLHAGILLLRLVDFFMAKGFDGSCSFPGSSTRSFFQNTGVAVSKFQPGFCFWCCFIF